MYCGLTVHCNSSSIRFWVHARTSCAKSIPPSRLCRLRVWFLLPCHLELCSGVCALLLHSLHVYYYLSMSYKTSNYLPHWQAVSKYPTNIWLSHRVSRTGWTFSSDAVQHIVILWLPRVGVQVGVLSSPLKNIKLMIQNDNFFEQSIHWQVLFDFELIHTECNVAVAESGPPRRCVEVTPKNSSFLRHKQNVVWTRVPDELLVWFWNFKHWTSRCSCREWPTSRFVDVSGMNAVLDIAATDTVGPLYSGATCHHLRCVKATPKK